MKVVLLCGGKGTRWTNGEQEAPKALAMIAGRPLIWHVMEVYSASGFNDFVLAVGFKADQIRSYFSSHCAVQESTGRYEIDAAPGIRWQVQLVDTGVETQTAGRLLRVADLVGQERFMVSYGDGVADIDINSLLAFHNEHGGLATLTAVRPYSQFGILGFGDGGRVDSFIEKPKLVDWVNGGFFVFEPGVIDYLDDGPLENVPLSRLASHQELFAYRLEGFWACLDTYKDMLALNEYCRDSRAPWRQLVTMSIESSNA